MSHLLRDIVADAVAGEPDVEIAADVHSLDELERCINTVRPELVIAAERDPGFARASRSLLRRRLLPPFLVLTDEGSAAYLHWTRPETTSLGHLSHEALLREIRAAASLDKHWLAEAEETQ
jgi:hypothetical protein